MNDPTIWAAVGSALAAAYSGWNSRRANKQTKSTGNGFAAHVKEDLAEIKAGIVRVEDKIDHHLQDHAGADLRRVK